MIKTQNSTPYWELPLKDHFLILPGKPAWVGSQTLVSMALTVR